jgi:flagellar basal body-associated protein FliL
VDIFWIIVTVLIVVAIIAMWIIFGVRGSIVSRAEHAKPDDAKGLREVQRQIDSGYTYSARRGPSDFPWAR